VSEQEGSEVRYNPTMLLLTLALAEPPNGWEEVVPFPRIDHGVLLQDRAWAAGSCAPVDLLHGAETTWRTEDCKVRSGEAHRCEDFGTVSTHVYAHKSRCPQGDDGEMQVMTAFAPGVPPYRLVWLTGEEARWETMFRAHAEPASLERVTQPCLSSADLDPDVSVDHVRTCTFGEGVVVLPGDPPTAAPVGLPEVHDPEPVDCRLPCPDDPNQAIVDAMNEALEGRWFADPDARDIHWYATEEACRADHPEPPPTPEVCR